MFLIFKMIYVLSCYNRDFWFEVLMLFLKGVWVIVSTQHNARIAQKKCLPSPGSERRLSYYGHFQKHGFQNWTWDLPIQ